MREETFPEVLPFSHLLRPHIETALWPHLYPKDSICESNMSEVFDYALRLDLLQFRYDQQVLGHFNKVGTRAHGISLGRALNEFPDSPQDLRMKRAALADLARQLGRACFLVTFDPGAYATTWSHFVERTRHMAGQRFWETTLWKHFM